MNKTVFLITLSALLILTACDQNGTAPTATPEAPRTLTVMTHDSFALSEDVAAAFEAENNVTLQFLKAGDTGTAVNKAVLAKDNPLADIFYGIDNTFLSRALEEDIFESYPSPILV